MTQRIFDGHNDVLLRLWRHDRSGESFLAHGVDGHIDLGRASRGGLKGGMFATFVPDGDRSAVERHQSQGNGAVGVPEIAGQRQECCLRRVYGPAVSCGAGRQASALVFRSASRRRPTSATD